MCGTVDAVDRAIGGLDYDLGQTIAVEIRYRGHG